MSRLSRLRVWLVEQQIQPELRGKPIGVTPFRGGDFTVVIACSKEAKAKGVKNIMWVPDALKVCPELILVTQKPDMYRRAHNALAASIESVIPIDVAKSIDELTCKLDRNDIADPYGLTTRIKDAIRHTMVIAVHNGAIIPIFDDMDMEERCVLERHVSIDTTASGGNVSWLAGLSS